MLVECLVIFGIILAIAVIFAKTRKEYAIATVPLLIPTGTNILAYLFSENLSELFPIDHLTMYIVINVIAVIVSSVFVGICSTKLKTKSNRLTYIVMCILFNIALATILIINMYKIYD